MSGVALITGAADRIGAGMARGLAKAGFKVIVHYNRSQSKAEDLVAEIASNGGEAACMGADLTDTDARGSLVGRAGEPFGPLTVLINNASVFHADTADAIDEDHWHIHFTLHAEVPTRLAADFARQLPDDASGSVINMIDERVLRPDSEFFSYYLSKSVLWTATRNMALTFAPRIRVNAIGPGPTLQDVHQTEAEFEASQRALPLQQGADLEDFARAALFLIETPSVTGQMLALDGGAHLNWRRKDGDK